MFQKKSIFLLFPGHWFRAKNQLAPEKNGTARNSKQLLVNSFHKHIKRHNARSSTSLKVKPNHSIMSKPHDTISQRIVTPLFHQQEGELPCQQKDNDNDDDDCSELVPRELPFPTARTTTHHPKMNATITVQNDVEDPANISICTELSNTNSLDVRIQNVLNRLDLNRLDQETLHLIDKVNTLSQEKSSVYDSVLVSLISILEQRLGNHTLKRIGSNPTTHDTLQYEHDEVKDPAVEEETRERMHHSQDDNHHVQSNLVRLEQEHKQLRNIIRDLGYASLLPDYIQRDDDDDDSSLLSTSLCSIPQQYIYAQNQRMSRHVMMHHPPPHTIHEHSISHHSEEYHSMAQSQHYLQEQIYQYQGEIQSLHAQIDSLSSENARLHSDVHGLTQQRDNDKQLCKSLEMELHQVTLAKTEAWREMNHILEEKMKSDRELVGLRQENESLRYELSQREDTNNQMRHQISQLEEDVQIRIRDTMVVEQKWNEAKTEVQTMSANLAASEVEQQTLKECLNSANDHVRNLEAQLTNLQRRCASHDAQFTKEQNRVSSLEKERDSMKSILEEERQRSTTLRDDLADSVAREAVASEQIKTLLKEKTSLATQLNLAMARNSFGNKASPLTAKSITFTNSRNRPKSLVSSRKSTDEEIPKKETALDPCISTQEVKEKESHLSNDVMLDSGSSSLLDYISQDENDSLALI